MTDNMWNGQAAAEDAAHAPARERWFHGKLMPIKVRYLKWAPKKKGEKGEKPTEVTREQYNKLERGKGGQEVIFEIDPRVVAPTLEFNISRKTLLGGDVWNTIILPSINDTIGAGDKSLAAFADRAAENKWFVEGKLVPTGRTFEGREGKVMQETMPKFTRMTDNQDELFAWNMERFPRTKEEIPADILESAKVVFERMAKKDLAKFTKLLGDNEEFQPYAEELIEEAKDW